MPETSSADVFAGGGTAEEYRLARAKERTEAPPPMIPAPQPAAGESAPTRADIRAARQQEQGAKPGSQAVSVENVPRSPQEEAREPERQLPADDPGQESFERAENDRNADGREIPQEELERRLAAEASGADRERQTAGRGGNRSAKRRVEKAISERNRTYEENIKLRAQNEELKRQQAIRQQQARQPAQAPPPPSDEILGLNPEPKQGDYDDVAEWVKALMEYQNTRAAAIHQFYQHQGAALAEQDASERAGRERQIARQAHVERMSERQKNDPMFASLVNQRVKENGNNSVALRDLTDPMLDAMAEMEHGDAVHAHLIAHPELVSEIAGETVTKQVGRIHVLASQLSDGPAPSTTPPPTAPLRTSVQDSGGGYPDDIKAYKERRNRERASKNAYLRSA